MTDITAPSIAVALVITPLTCSRAGGEDNIPELSVKATLDPSAPKPVTVLTWSTIFNPCLALKRRNFAAQDISQEPPTTIKLEISKGPKRAGFQRNRGSSDEKYYMTLQPGQEITAAIHPFDVIKRVRNNAFVFEAGHSYRLELSEEGEKVSTWWWGTTNDVLNEVGRPPKDISGIRGVGEIVLSMEPVTFQIAE
ncbi:hypothetical protein AB5N19_14178 [Seiridium cardinale]|uniref:Uncharacterized protein n=1 Tax=Seiridium cardinale TaxID=138064 RepID=A0ABR2X8S4_9PEZI